MDDEFLLISCCLKNCTVGEMAERLGMSQSGVKKRLSALYGKMGVKNKNEMVRKYVRSVINIEKDKKK